MNIFVAWRDSLTLFQPKNFKLFFLVTLKSMVDTFKVWIKYFWWLIVLPIIFLVLLSNDAMRMQIVQFYGMVQNIIPPIIYMMMPSFMDIIVVTILLAARPSTALKNCAYFRTYFFRGVLMTFVIRLAELCGEIVLTLYWNQLLASPFIFKVMAFIHTLLKWYAIDYVLFYLDSDGSFKSFLRSWLHAAKMLIFNLPFYSISAFSFLALIRLCVWFTQVIYGTGNVYIMGSIYTILLLVFQIVDFFKYCFLTNFYVKKLHDQFTLYFGKNA